MGITRKSRTEEGGNDWMDTFADTITLLLAFFVILLSISEPKRAKFEEVKQGMSSEFTEELPATPTRSLMKNLESIIATHQMQRYAAFEDTGKGIRIEFDSASFFDSGQASLKPEAQTVLRDLAGVMQGLDYEPYDIRVEGHTDDVPISTERYPSNWELSGARAASVARFFIQEGIAANRLSASGFADTRPKVPNADIYGHPMPENRAINRRVVLNLERWEE